MSKHNLHTTIVATAIGVALCFSCGPVQSPVLSSRVFALSFQGGNLWSVETGRLLRHDLTGKCVQTIDLPFKDIRCATFSRNAAYVITESGSLMSFDLQSAQIRKNDFPTITNAVAMYASNDGKTLAIGDGRGYVHLIGAKGVERYEVPGELISTVSFSADDVNLFFGSLSGNYWTLDTRRKAIDQLPTMHRQSMPIRASCYIADCKGYVISDGTYLWFVGRGKPATKYNISASIIAIKGGLKVCSLVGNASGSVICYGLSSETEVRADKTTHTAEELHVLTRDADLLIGGALSGPVSLSTDGIYIAYVIAGRVKVQSLKQ